MINYPPYADLGIDVTPEMQNSWNAMLVEIDQYHRYFTGDIFREVTTDVSSNANEEIPLYPAGINLVKTICTAIADAVFGQWTEQPVNFTVSGSAEISSSQQQAIDIANGIMRTSGAGRMFWETELDRQVYGGGAIRVVPTMNKPYYLRWVRVMRDCLLPVWDPEDPDTLLEAYVITRMNKEQAKVKLAYDAPHEETIYWEHWTPWSYETGVDTTRLTKGTNPWKMVPIVFIPRIRTYKLWGDALTSDLIPLQDTVNMRVADIDDTISYNSHPIRWGVNLPRQFSAQNFPVGINSMWDLGRTPGDAEPKVGLLEPKGTVIEDAMGYIRFLYEVARTSSSTPAVVFGEDYGAGQRSGDTLELRMRPFVSMIIRNQAYWTQAFLKLLQISSVIYKQRQYEEVPVRAAEKLTDLVPRYAPILPRDQNAIVDEVVKLLSTDPPAISLDTAVLKLGHGHGEVEKIKRMIADDDLDEPVPMAQEMNSEGGIPDGRARPVSRPESDRASEKDSQ